MPAKRAIDASDSSEQAVELKSLHEHTFVFIGGVHRSGTTILHDCLSDHPEICGFSDTGVPMNEGQFLQAVYPPANTKRKLWPLRYLKRFTPYSISARGYGGPGRFGFDPGSHLDESSSLVSPRNATLILESWSRYWDMDCPLLLEKSPPNILRTRFLQALFPDSYFIIVRRHPIPVSYSTRRWTKHRPLYFLLKHWLLCQERFSADKPKLRHVVDLRIEDFVRDPQTVLNRLYGFLRVEPISIAHRKVYSSINDKYFKRWNDSQRSHTRLKYTNFLRKRFESELNRFGYTLGDPLLEGPDAGLV